MTISRPPRALGALGALLALALAAPLSAQTISSVTPEAVAPGTLMTIRGNALAATTHVRFQAVVGGFVGVWSQDEPVLSASADTVRVLAPDIVAGFVFVGPSVGSPFASLQTVQPGSLSPQAKVYLFEGSDGFLASAGLGTTHSGGDRASASFDLDQGPPTSPNPGFVATMHHAPAGALPVLAIGLPIPPVPFGDGLLAVHPASTFALLPAPAVDPLGDAARAVPIPAIAGVTVALQWGYLEPASGAIGISDAMMIAY